jgi:hypothetical protein
MVVNQLDDELFPDEDESAELPLDNSTIADESRSIATTTGPVAKKSQFSRTQCDLIRITASRFTFSREYIIGYLILTALSIVTVAISLATPQGCPHISFYILEIVVLVALISEVVLRAVALQRHFWKSYWNIADVVVMVICAVTLGLVFAGCSTAVRRERQSGTILLVIRNVVQFVRLIVLVWRNRHNITNRQVDIDLDQVEDFTLTEDDTAYDRLDAHDYE